MSVGDRAFRELNRTPGIRTARKGRTRARMLMPHRVCQTGKDIYASYAVAHNQAERMMTNGQVEPGCHITPYKCEFCFSFHVTNRKIVFKD